MLANHPSSAGSIIKKITEINPSLDVEKIAWILRSSMEKRVSEQFSGSSDEINEAKALQMARATLTTM